VRLEVHAQPERVLLSVADDGPGIAEQDRNRAQQPFVRLDESSSASGSGLGLSLVRAIARLHRGDIELADNRPGLRISCSFPRVPV
jgi:signal transduction histidine kinase